MFIADSPRKNCFSKVAEARKIEPFQAREIRLGVAPGPQAGTNYAGARRGHSFVRASPLG